MHTLFFYFFLLIKIVKQDFRIQFMRKLMLTFINTIFYWVRHLITLFHFLYFILENLLTCYYPFFLDVLIVNQTSETLQNLSIEFATLGDLKLVERPTQHNLAKHSFHSVKATIKVDMMKFLFPSFLPC